jgi:hypothetical protein
MVSRAGRIKPSPDEHVPPPKVTVDYLILSDFAQVLQGKLYLMGGGWSRYTPPSYPAQMQMGIAVGVRVPWLESNTPHQLTLVVRNDDDQTELVRLDAQLETGRPPGSRGEDQLVPMALNGQTVLQAPGDFVIVASIDGVEGKRYTFKAVSRNG